MKRARKGFTLVEVTVVLVIIAIIAAIAVPNISGYIDKSKRNNCQSVMNSFISDIENKVVSKRYFDLSELNSALTEVVKNYGDIKKSDGSESLDSVTNGTEFLVSGACPNGGNYRFRWTITPVESENEWTVKSADVQLGINVDSETGICECDCMNSEEHVTKNTHKFTAALVSTEYKESRPPEEIAGDDIQKIISKIESPETNKADIAALVQNFSDDKYTINGITLNSAGDKVEWICVYQRDVRENDNVLFYSVTRNSYTLSDQPSVQINEERKVFSIPASDILDESGKLKDLSKLPPAEGSAGSTVYKEGWNVPYTVAGADSSTGKANKIPVAYMNNSEVEDLGWIQKTGNWYVQKNDSVYGIDIPEDSEKVLVDTLSNGEASLDYEESAEGNPDSQMKLEASESASLSDLKNAFKVNIVYQNGKSQTFSHLEKIETDNGYYIKNGYIIVDPDADVKLYNWTGVFGAPAAEGEISDVARKNLDDLDYLLAEEENIIRRFENGEYGDGDSINAKVAYQEYYKYLDESDGKYKYRPVTVFKIITLTKDAVPDENTPPELSVNPLNNKIENTVKLPVEVTGSPNNILLTTKQEVTYTRPSGGSGSLMVGGKEEGTISVSDVADSYNIVYKQTGDSEKFSLNDLVITKKVKYDVTQKVTLEDGTVKDVSVGSFTEDITLKPAVSADQSNGYYLSGDSNFDGGQTPASKTSESVSLLNNGGTEKRIYLTGFNDGSISIGTVSTQNSVQNSLKWSYTPKKDDNEFMFERINVSIDYPVSVTTSFSGYPSVGTASSLSEGTVKVTLGHRTAEGGDGYYLEGVTEEEKKLSESDLYNRLKAYESSAVVKLYKANEGQCNNISLFEVSNEYEFISAYYDSEGSHYNGIVFGWFSSSQYYDDLLIANANYLIKVVDKKNGEEYQFPRVESLFYKDSPDRKYYLSENKCTDYTKAQTNDDAVRNKLRNKFNQDVWVLYKDYYTDTLKQTTVRINLDNGVNASEFIYKKLSNNSSEVYIEGYTGAEKYLEIPSELKGYWDDTRPSGWNAPKYTEIQYNGKTIYYIADNNTYKVKQIGNGASIKFTADGYELYSVSVPSSVNKICANAFSGQKSLRSFTLPETGLTTIEQGAFEGAAVSGLEFKIPSSVTTIGTNAFKNFSLPNGELKINGVSDSAAMSIEKDIFTESKFKKLSFGGSVKKIGISAFSGNSSSASLNLGSVTQIDDFAFMGCVNMKGGLEIPSGVDSVGFQAFDSYAVSTTGTDTGKLVLYSGSSNSGKNLGGLIFTNAKFSGITIPASSKIENISKYAFRNSPYKNKMPYKNIKGPLEILGSVKLIDNSAFEDCTGLTGELSIPESTLTIGDAAFLGCCNLSKLSFAENSELTSIGSRAFMECQSFSGRLELEKTKIKSIGMQAFRNCKNFSGNLIIPQTVTGENGQLGIGYCAFENFASRASFDENASNKAGQLILKAGTCSMGKEVGPFTFTGSHFDGVVIGGSDSIVERVGAYAFKNPDSGELSLYPDDSINHNGVDHSTTHNTDNNPVDENRNTETEDEYFNQTESQISQTLTVDYSGIHGDLSVENGVTEIGESAFENCTGLTGSLNLKYTEKIGTKAFLECSGFNGNLTLSPALDTLGDSAFENCKNITGSLVIPHTLSVIGNSAFNGCSGFNGTLTLANKRDDDGVSLKGVTSIKSSAFKNCTGFKGGVTVPESVGYIGDSAFRNFAAAVLPADAGELRILGSSYTDENTGVRGIGGMIFTGGRYNNIYIGGKVTKINAQAFDTTTERNGGIDYSTPSPDSDYSKVRGYLEIADTVTHIGNKAFCGVKFDRYVTLGTGLQEIGAHAFDHCTDVSYDNNHKGLTIHNKVTSIGVQAFNSFGSAEHPGELTILGYSEEYENTEKKYTEHVIGYHDPVTRTIFCNSKFRNVTIGGPGATVDTVGYRFMMTDTGYDYSNVKGNLTIGSGVTKVMGEAFNLTGFDGYIDLENASSLTTIGVSSFEGLYDAKGKMSSDGKATLTIPENVTSIGVRAFKSFAKNITDDADLSVLCVKGYSENDSDHTLGYRLFSQAHFKGVEIGGNVKTIGKFAFYNSGLKTDQVDEKVQEEYKISETDTEQGLKDENGVRYTGFLLNNKSSNYEGFSGTVEIGPDVEKIDDFAFGNCGNLTGLVFEKRGDSSGTESADAENSEFSSTDYDREYEGKTSLSTIGYASFIRCNHMQGKLVIPNSVSRIGRCAFKQYAQAITEESEMSELIILGSSMERKINGETKYILGNIDKREDQDPDPIFPSANFKNIYIGGKIDIIACSFMNNKQHLKSQYTDIKDTSGTFDYTGLHGNLTIGPSVEEIKAEAFYGCENLKGRLIFKEDADGNTRLNTIGNNAFNSCVNFGGGLTIPESVEKIGIGAFKYMSQGMEGYKPVLGELKILGYSSSKTIDKVTYNTIDARIFDHAHFRNITIGGKVQYVEEAFMCNFNDYPYAAEGKAQYVDIYEDENGNKYTPVTRYNGVYGDVKLGKTVQIVGKNAFWDCHNLNGQLKFNDDSVPVGEGIEAAGIQKIGENAFSGCTAFSYPNTSGVISIVDKYFTGFTVDYDGLVIPSSVKEIGSFAFKGFGSGYGASAGHLWLHSGSANNGKTIEPLVFTGSKFNGIYIGGNITKIEDKAFYSNPGGESFSYKDKSLTTDDANYNNWTGDILILGYENASGNGVRVIGEKAFFNHQNMNGLLWLNNGIETIGENAFNRFYKAQRNLVIPPSVKEIGNCAFKGYAQQTPEANRGRLEIYGGSCDNGKTLGTVDSNGGITPIFPYSRFNSVCIGGNIARISANAFAQGSPERNRETNNTYEYSGLTGDLIFSGSVTEIGANAFKGCTGFSKRLVFNGNFMANNGYDDISGNADGAKLREIGAYAFSGCTNFYSDYVTEDGSQAVFTVPDSVRTIGEHAFSSMCSGIPDTFYSRVPKLNLLGVSHDIDSAFGSSGNKNSQDKYPTIQIFDNAKFNNVYIGGSVKVIAENAFDNSSGVYSKIRGDIELNVEKIWAKAFYMMHTGDMGTNRKKLILDSGLTTLGDQAFGNSQFFGDCPANERVLDIPSSLTTIYGDPFNKFCPNYYNKTIINKKSDQNIGKADGAGITIVNN